MLKLSEALVDINVLSLRTSSPIGTAVEMIINPNNLKIEGWYVHDRFSDKKLVLVSSEVREVASQGLIVNDHEVLAEAEDLVRLKPTMDIGFVLAGKRVVSQEGVKYGKVTDFAIETESLLVKKIYASQSIIKSISAGSKSIDRTQIVEITNTKIVIEDATEKSSETATVPSVAN